MGEAAKKPVRDEAALRHLADSFGRFRDQGNFVDRCDQCHGTIEFYRVGDEVWQSKCDCGKYSGTLRGL